MPVFKAAVIGAGTMGGEIAQLIAAADIDVVLKDIDERLVELGLAKAREVTEGQLEKLVAKGKLSAEAAEARRDEVIGRIEGTTSYSGFGDVDFAIEAVPERVEVKQDVFAELDEVTPGHAVLASNTSSLSITEIGEVTLRPERVCGFHFFYPASVSPLVEIVEGDDTAPDTATAALRFAMAVRKQPIVCGEVPGFVVNRILSSAISEIWRAQEEGGLSIKALDEGITAAQAAPVGPFTLTDVLGLDTVLHVAEHLRESYGERFHVHQGLRELVAEGKLGAKSGGEGFYSDGEPQLPGDAEPDIDALAEAFATKALVEACLLLEEGVCTVREIDLGMMAGAGFDPRRGLLPPFWKADVEGLEVALERAERLAEAHPDRFVVPRTLRRLVAQGRRGTEAGQGFFAYPRPDDGEQPEAVKLETRGDGVAIAWLQNPPMNAISPQVIGDLRAVWERVRAGGKVRALVIASAIPLVYSAGADLKAFKSMDEAAGARLLADGHELLRELGSEGVVTIAAVNSLALGGGCELAMACDLRLAAASAIFGQPEIDLGIIPGLGGTQRLPRLVGAQKALELNLTGEAITAEDAYEHGLVNRVVADHELLDVALGLARKLAGQAPLAIEQIKRVSAAADLDQGIEVEQRGFAAVFASEDAKEGIAAFLEKRRPQWSGT